MDTTPVLTEISKAVVYLTPADYVAGEVLHGDGGAHIGRW